METRKPAPIRYNLSVPYSEKDDAKELGARWDATMKKWYALSNNPHYNELVERWP